jgi:hypothetical protein
MAFNLGIGGQLRGLVISALLTQLLSAHTTDAAIRQVFRAR